MDVIDKNSPLTLTYQLTRILRSQILGGRHREGSLFHTENELIEMYKVSRITVRKALENLVLEGLLYRERGRGTFVSKKKVESDAARLISTTKTFQALGIKSGIKVLSIEKIIADYLISAKLGLVDDEKVYRLERLRLADGEPMIIDISYLPERLFPDIDTQDLNQSLYELMDSKYNIQLVGSSETFIAATLDRKWAALLNCKVGSPAFIMTGVTYRQGKIPTTFEKCIYRADRFGIKVEASANHPRGLQFIGK